MINSGVARVDFGEISMILRSRVFFVTEKSFRYKWMRGYHEQSV